MSTLIIIINFYGAYILRNLNSEAQQNREQGRAKVIIRTRDNRIYMVEMQFGINMSIGFFEDIYSFRCFQSDVEFIPDPRRSGKKSPFAHVRFKSISCEIDDLRCLGIFERYRRLAK